MKILSSAKRILALGSKEWIQIYRDGRSLVLSFLLPVIMMVIFGYALSMDVTHVKLVVLDNDKTPFSRSLIEEFSHNEYISVINFASNNGEIDSLLNGGEAAMGLVIPVEFEKRHLSGKSADIQLLVDGSDSSSALVSIGYVQAIVLDFNQANEISEMKQNGIKNPEIPVDIRSRIMYNSELKSKNFIIPGILAIIMAIISALITSLTISREWERGTMETLISTPVRRFELFTGKMIPYIFIALFDVIVSVCLGYFIFGVPLKGNFTELYLIALLFLIGNSSLGILISSATKSQVLSVQLSMMITFLPSFILSGYVFPVKNMPAIVQAFTYLVPAKYLILCIKGIALKGIGLTLLWSQILFLFLFCIIVAIGSIKYLDLRIPE